MALNYAGSLNGTGQKLMTYKLKASTTFVIGEVVHMYSQTDGTIDHGAAATPLLGVLVGILDSSLNPAFSSIVTAGTASGTNTTSQATGTTYTYYGLVDTNPNSIFSASVSGTLGTTVTSTKGGYWIDINSANTTYGSVLETTATRTAATTANFYCLGLDPAISTRVLVKIANHEFNKSSS